MPRKAQEAYTITYAVLGFLARWGATSGYDLKRRFDQGMGYAWEATHSQIYNELRRLKRYGWAEMETEEQDTRPDRKVYHITERGQEALSVWLRQPVGLPRLRDELALKTMLGAFAPEKTLLQNLQAAALVHEQRLAELQQELSDHGDPGDVAAWEQPIESGKTRDPYIGLVVQFGIHFEAMYLDWLHESITLLEANLK